jgi:hypothetical protein
MALETEVKSYLACWMQLGTKVWLQKGQTWSQVQNVLENTRYSPEFEACWAQVREASSGDCYLEGTTVTLQELLGDSWDIIDCARCNMPVALPKAGVPVSDCPCQGLSNWPNTEIPCPRAPVNSQDHLKALQQRLSIPRMREG